MERRRRADRPGPRPARRGHRRGAHRRAEERFVPGAVLATEPAVGRPADPGERPRTTTAPCCSASPASPTAPRPRGCAACSLRGRHGRGRGRRGRVVRPRAGRPARRAPSPASRLGEVVGAGAPARPGPARGAAADGRDGAGPVRRGDRAGGRRGRRPRGHRPAGRAVRPRTSRRGPGADCALDVVTIFPEYLAPLDLSLSARPASSGLLDLRVHDLRDWTHDRHRTVDDTPYGGGAGMVMRPEPWGEALDDVLADAAPRRRRRRTAPASCPTPGGRPFTQAMAARARRASPGWSSPAAATRASTSGSSTTRATADAGQRGLARRLRARRRRGRRAGRSSRRSPGCCPASSATPSRLVEESPRGSACWSTPSTPSRRRGAGRDVPEVLLSRPPRRRSPGGGATSALRRTAARRPDLVAALDPAAPRQARPRGARRSGLAPDRASGRFRAGAACCGRLGRCVARRPRPCHRGTTPRRRPARTSRPT